MYIYIHIHIHIHTSMLTDRAALLARAAAATELSV